MASFNSGLTVDQVDEYLTYIQLPAQFQRNQNPRLELDFLAAIQAHHICRIPYENVALHYSQNPSISLDVVEIYHKFVVRGRGGYCMENNIFLYHVLCILGFQVYLTGARLYRETSHPTSGWSGWEHAVNIVTLKSGVQYMVDVGYGGDGPTIPLPLITDTVTPNIGTQELRLLYGNVPGLSDRRKDLWTYQFRNNVDHPWKPAYAFFEIEFFQRDFEVMNFYTSRSASCFLTSHLLVVRFLRKEGKVYGKMILDQEKVKENQGGKNVLIKTCETENERIEALRDHFDINLTETEKHAISGKDSAIGS
ncbi:arylamine N-acetyltransferase 1 [Penicillium hispanicum]|uniref:arylamine N-acetyltransferase 1 n=1 Tax=Penicillium hispanicum TaxID=1080232 RepID=UPI002540CECE|nr:arylamine N-acetyltransferase 1 [Penicillium hispanicum]KAJ5584192.1 arylamine N-acetyltransferase 1 [Penicillium hispanicum]